MFKKFVKSAPQETEVKIEEAMFNLFREIEIIQTQMPKWYKVEMANLIWNSGKLIFTKYYLGILIFSLFLTPACAVLCIVVKVADFYQQVMKLTQNNDFYDFPMPGKVFILTI